jgi:hypothetical protein
LLTIPPPSYAFRLQEKRKEAAEEKSSGYEAYRDKNRSLSATDPGSWDDDVKVKALYDFEGTMECDLSFRKNAQITVLTRTASQNDWWEGQIFDRIGIFPANYVTFV